MFERAKKFFQGYIKDPAKHGYVDWSVNELLSLNKKKPLVP